MMSTEVKITTRVLPLALKLSDTAHELSCSIGFIYELVEARKLDLIKPGPKTSRITGESLARLLAERAKPDADIPNLKQFKKTPDPVSGS